VIGLEQKYKALGNKNRLRIVKLLEKKAMCVCELVEVIGISQSTISKHLKILVNAGLLSAVKDGQWTNYQLNKTDEYSKILLQDLSGWLNSDKTISRDLKKATKVNRYNIKN